MTEERPTILHYVGYDDDSGGIVSVVRALAATGVFDCRLGMNLGGAQQRQPALRQMEFRRLKGEDIGLRTGWRARQVAREVQAWLQAGPNRIFHGHSRAGLLVALWLQRWGERRVVASVHCYGKQRWFYRRAARQLGGRLFWLSPAMRAYYGVPGDGWDQCIPGGVVPPRVAPATRVDGRLRLGGVGTLVPWKGWDTVIEALALLPADQKAAVSFEHIGAGDARTAAALRGLVKAGGLAAQVQFCGPEAGPERLLGQIDALVVASKNEPFSIAMLEALAAGIPVIAAESGGAIDIIRPNENGEFFATGDARALSACLRRWLERRPVVDRAKIRSTTILAGDVAARWQQVYATLV